ncbi:MAG: DNA polymerase III subunit delta [Candidatus Magasanikbacteria bacterium]
MIIFLFGKDTYRSRQQMKKMISKFRVERDPSGMNVSILNCEVEEPGTLLEHILAVPFLAERRMVVLESFLSSKHKNLQENIIERIQEKKLPEDNVYIFWEDTDTFRNKTNKDLFEILKKEKFSQQFDILSVPQLQSFIEQEIAEGGGKIEKNALIHFSQNTTGDMWKTAGIISQILAYKNTEIITLDDINLFLEKKVDDNIFNLVDAILEKKSKQIFAMIREQTKLRDAHYVFAMVLRQMRILLEMKDLEERKYNLQDSTLPKKLGLHPFVFKKTIPLLKKFTYRELKEIYQYLLQIDKDLKTGGNDEVLVDILAGKLCSK